MSEATAEIHRSTPLEQPLPTRVLAVLDVARTPAEVARAIGVSGAEIDRALLDLADRGLVVAVEGGRWRA